MAQNDGCAAGDGAAGGGIPAAATAAFAEEQAVEKLVQSWTGDSLVAQKAAGESYTTDVIGVREPSSSSRGDWYWIKDLKPQSTNPDGSLIFKQGAMVSVEVRYNTDGTYL